MYKKLLEICSKCRKDYEDCKCKKQTGSIKLALLNNEIDFDDYLSTK